jgi:N6-adenosine-specific RNA methylase IME4
MPYSTMSVAEIIALPVQNLAMPDAHLYLWTTQRYLRNSFYALDAWGFKLGSVLVWAKPPKGVAGTFVSSTEFCLFGRRGILPHKTRHMGTCFHWPRPGHHHSQKPEAFIDLVEQVSPGPYVELFARRHRLGWDVWGDQSANTAMLQSPA